MAGELANSVIRPYESSYVDSYRLIYRVRPSKADRCQEYSTLVDELRSAGDQLIRVLARVQVLATADGGRSGPFTARYRPNHNFGGAEDREFFMGQVEVPEGEWVYPGETRELAITFVNVAGLRELLTPGRRWRIQEGWRLVATAELLSLLPMS